MRHRNSRFVSYSFHYNTLNFQCSVVLLLPYKLCIAQHETFTHAVVLPLPKKPFAFREPNSLGKIFFEVSIFYIKYYDKLVVQFDCMFFCVNFNVSKTDNNIVLNDY